ncbi:MAG: M14 family metallopeptidase [Myxococcota bacterium]
MLAFLLSLWISGPAQAADLAQWASTRPNPAPVPEVAEGYRFTGDLFAHLARRAAERPGVVTVESIGESVRGEPIWAFHVQRPGPEAPQKALVFAGIHALEWISTEVAVDLLDELIEAPPDGVRVTVIPLLNPDGRDRVEQDLMSGENRYRRGNGANIDLNRDFAVNTEVRAVWSALIPGYYSHSAVPLSQPESRALDRLLAREGYDRSASLHAFGGYIYTPWAGRFARPEAWAEHVELGRRMERAQGAHAYRTRQLARWGFFFRAQGAEVDHVYGTYGTLSYLIELTRSGVDLRRPFHSWKTYFRWYNPTNVARHRKKGLAAVRVLARDWE